MRLFKSALFLFVFFIIAPSFVFAAIIGGGNQQPTREPDPCTNLLNTGSSFEGAGFSTVPAMECIDESIQKVTVTFHNLTEDTEYKVCAGSKFCLLDEKAVPLVIGISKLIIGDSDRLTADENGDVEVIVCGRNENVIKINDDCVDGPDGDYFHGGNVYLFSIGVVDNGRYLLSEKAGFYVSRSYPQVRISPNTNITPGDLVNVSLTDTSPRPGGGKRNNYQVQIKGGEFYDEKECLTLGVGKDKTKSITFGKTLPAGKFTITIKEQVKEGDGCQGGFTYYKIACEATTRDGGGRCDDPEENKDPEGEEYKQFIKDLQISGEEDFILFPCGSGTLAESTNPGDCPSLDTAIGSISATPQGFIADTFRFVLAIAGFGAIILIIYSGYLFMTSQGDKERIAGARETITSAIVGLLFIILSFIVLEIIGFDILRIPGITR
ncbi:MAG: hypothetical protein HY427_03365 [Candidatus Levybacteria bacterium]|nr:hypothetical protein [Candidatus Levybacteria bacterium]